MLNHCKNNAKNNWYIGKSNTYASHQACFLCFLANPTQSWVPLQGWFPLQGMLSVQQKAISCMVWVFAWRHGGKCIAFTSMAVHGKPS